MCNPSVVILSAADETETDASCVMAANLATGRDEERLLVLEDEVVRTTTVLAVNAATNAAAAGVKRATVAEHFMVNPSTSSPATPTKTTNHITTALPSGTPFGGLPPFHPRII